ncbi:serine/threonine-protein kinase Nek3-like isoform X2 [Apostichopus japonicus]|uniref:serine/threonine-protein kinase Nek3-like isoform X2 n=1 Tax=Stichopus japonicus TaxID=307972 RepID=UPI003AB7F22B
MAEASRPAYIQHGYRLITNIGQGKFGNTYSVANAGKVFAMKELEKVQTKAKFEKDKKFQILLTLKHDNVVSYSDFFPDVSAKLYIVMEYCELGDLTKVLTSGDPRVPIEKFTAGVMRQLCYGIEYIHGKNLVHGNIKPENIFIKGDGVIKIGDIRLSGMLGHGKPGYISPECAEGHRNTSSSDMWAVGRVLFDLCTLGTVKWDEKCLQLRPDSSAKLTTFYSRLLASGSGSRLTAAEAHTYLRKMSITRRATGGIYIQEPAGGNSIVSRPAGGNSIVSTIITSLGLAAFQIGDDDDDDDDDDDEDRVEVRAFRR